jgi:hypothetical protein
MGAPYVFLKSNRMMGVACVISMFEVNKKQKTNH